MNANGKREREEEETEACKKPKLHTDDALGRVLQETLEGALYLPKELRDLIIDFTAPTELRRLVDATDCLFPTRPDNDRLEAALWSVFNHFATRPNPNEPPFYRTMSFEDYKRCDAIEVDRSDGSHVMPTWRDAMRRYGLPNLRGRSELSFQGFCEWYRDAFDTTSDEIETHLMLRRLADYLEPPHSQT